MSTPTLQFSNLSLPDDYPNESAAEDMPFERTTLEERKLVVRDIIASFEPEQLPSELFDLDHLQRITADQADRPRSELTIHHDLKTTLLHWCCHDKAGWTFLIKLHDGTMRALLFAQKAERRLGEQFAAYDALADHGPRGTAGQVKMWVLQICEQMRILVEEIEVDVETRVGGQYSAARILLETLRRVCERDVDLPTSRRSGRLEGALEAAIVPTLFQGTVKSGSQHFIVDALEAVQQRWPRSLATGEAQAAMGAIRELLVENGAPADYLTHFQALM